MNTRSCGEFLIRLLESYGVECLFGIPGVHTVELYRGLGESSIEHITPRHEQGAGFAADGYARIANKPGVCLVITGPGVGNIVTAMGQAYADSIPMLVISSVNPLAYNRQGNGHLHELPHQSALMEQVASFSYTVTSPEELMPALARAYAVFDSGRPRPVHIEIPVDVLSMPAGLPVPHDRPRFSPPQAPSDVIDSMLALCSSSISPVILAGGGARQAASEVRRLAQRLNAPVVMSINARGLIGEDHPLAINASASLEPVRALIERADLVLALGTELGPTDYNAWLDGGVRIPGKLVRVDISAEQLSRNFTADLAVYSDLALALGALLNRLQERDAPGLMQEVKPTLNALDRSESQAYKAANHLLSAIWTALPDAIVVGDSTQPVYAGNDYTRIPDTARWFNSATGFGTLGYALPAAIGAKRAAGSQPVVSIAGDGGLQFSLAELATAKQAKLALTLIVWDNSGYGEIKQVMEDAGIEPEGVDLWTPQFELIGRAYGWDVVKVDNIQQFQDVLQQADEQSKNLMILGVEEVCQQD